jgi:hypothetical protein
VRRNNKSSVCFRVFVRMQLAGSAVMKPLDQITVLSTISLIPPTVFPADCNNAISYVWSNIINISSYSWDFGIGRAKPPSLTCWGCHMVCCIIKASRLVLGICTLLSWTNLYVFKKPFFFCLCVCVFSTHEIIRRFSCSSARLLLLAGFLIQCC